MSRKIKVNLSYFTYSILIHDAEVFRFLKNDYSINKNAFLNKLIYNFVDETNNTIDTFSTSLKSLLKDKLKKKDELDDIVSKITNLNENAEDNYKKNYSLSFVTTSKYEAVYDDIEDYYLKDMTLSRYLRKLFDTYARLNQDYRERIIFKQELNALVKAKENHHKVSLKLKKGNIKCSLVEVKATKDRQFLYLVLINDRTKELYPLNLYKVLDVRELREESDYTGTKLLGSETKDPQFLTSKEIDCKVKFTEKGMRLFSDILLYRPQVVKRDDCYLYFHCSFFQLYIYLNRVGKEALVIYPEELKERLRDFYYEALIKYDSDEM